ncbi:MAG: hypothetical protein J6I96_02545 [Oscillospiraceae bacterium]|nr:hypothetical protein [Oscillospiraceae bacterium]
MISTKRTIAAISAAIITASMIGSTAVSTVSAEMMHGCQFVSMSAGANNVKGTKADDVVDGTTKQKTLRPTTCFGGDKLKAQNDRLRRMRNDVIYVRIREPSWYHLKSTKLYGRKVLDVDNNGDFIIGDWELITSKADSKVFTISGDYVCFAYSGDITWGTDFPFSRVFWNEPHRDVEEVVITWGGGCRNASISINVKYNQAWGTWAGFNNSGLNEYISENNCSAHSEWKPC